MRLRLVHGGSNDHMYISILPSSRKAGADSNTGMLNAKGDHDGVGGEGEEEEEEEAAEAGVGDGDDGGRGGGSGDGGGTSGCTLLTLARDGVYLEAPRRQGGGAGHVLLTPGSRADLAVACDRPGVYRLASSRGGGDGVRLPVAYLGKKTDLFEGERLGGRVRVRVRVRARVKDRPGGRVRVCAGDLRSLVSHGDVEFFGRYLPLGITC